MKRMFNVNNHHPPIHIFFKTIISIQHIGIIPLAINYDRILFPLLLHIPLAIGIPSGNLT